MFVGKMNESSLMVKLEKNFKRQPLEIKTVFCTYLELNKC